MVESFDAWHAVPLQPVQPGGRRVERLFVSGQQHHVADELAPDRLKAALFHCDAQARIVRIGERLPLAGASLCEHDFVAELVKADIDVNKVRTHNGFRRVADGGLDAAPLIALERWQR